MSTTLDDFFSDNYKKECMICGSTENLIRFQRDANGKQCNYTCKACNDEAEAQEEAQRNASLSQDRAVYLREGGTEAGRQREQNSIEQRNRCSAASTSGDYE